jgi:acetyl-CoA carboxylase biotin carboxylase subunit
VIGAAVRAGAEALHPGWGFLAEDAAFARKLSDRGVAFIGPSPRFLEIMGDKVISRQRLAEAGLPCAPSTGELSGTLEERAGEAARLGFPLLVKPSGGGGGIGMIAAESEAELLKALEAAESQALRGFGRGAVYAERLVRNPRHVEFQVVADRHGSIRHLFDRDCSIQRRRQKVIEEAPAPGIGRAALSAMAGRAAGALGGLGYDHLGTLETLFDPQAHEPIQDPARAPARAPGRVPAGDPASGFSFLEVNPRLQVEHAVTEAVTGVDLAVLQLALASGASLSEALPAAPEAPAGHAVEARIYAEDSLRFLPSPGRLKVFRPPSGQSLRVEAGYGEGSLVTPFYDPMIAQVIAAGPTRDEALDALDSALAGFEVEGLKTNLGFLRLMIGHPDFRGGRIHTGLAEELLRSPGYRGRLAGLGTGS